MLLGFFRRPGKAGQLDKFLLCVDGDGVQQLLDRQVQTFQIITPPGLLDGVIGREQFFRVIAGRGDASAIVSAVMLIGKGAPRFPAFGGRLPDCHQGLR